jgi:hypothetical protein
MGFEETQFATGQIVDAVKHKGVFRMDGNSSSAAIFGQTRNAGASYYVLGGYTKRLKKEPEQKLYEYWDSGSVFTVTGNKCGGDDAEETFEVHDANADNNGNVPIPMLKALAFDLAARTVKAFGGADRLRAEIKAQRIDFNRLSPEIAGGIQALLR